MLLTGLLAGAAATVLGDAGGYRLPIAVLTGGGAFMGTVLLLLALARFAVRR